MYSIPNGEAPWGIHYYEESLWIRVVEIFAMNSVAPIE